MDYGKPYTYIVQIIKDGNITAAAEHLGISQPALSKYVRKTEQELGAEIFDRTTSPITLTRAGELFLKASERIQEEDRRLQKQLADIAEKQNAEFRVGIAPSRAPYLLPGILKAFREKSSARVVISEAATGELHERLLTGELDLIISLREGAVGAFRRVALFEEEILLAVPTGRKAETFEACLSALPLITHRLPVWQTPEKLIGTAPSTLECRNTVTAMAMVASGLGAAFVPSYIRDCGVGDGRITFLPLPEGYGVPKRSVDIYYRKGQYLSESEKLFISCAKQIKKT